MSAIEDATRLGLAVQAFIARPPLEPLLTAVPSVDTVREKLGLTLFYLETAHILTHEENLSLWGYVTDGHLPDVPADTPLLTVGTVLMTTVLHTHDTGIKSLFGGPVPALLHVAEAAMEGALHGGGPAALTCAAMGSMQVLRGIRSVRAEVSDDAVLGIRSGLKSGIKS